jgi:DNA-binding NarL/FixJ family response regulator
MNAIRLYLVDDEPHVRRGLRMRLEMEPDFEIVGESGDSAGAITGITATRPDVVLMDIELPGQDGIRTTASLSKTLPETAVVMVSMRDDPATRAQAREAGAAGFVGKHEIDFALTRAIRSAARNSGSRIDQQDQPREAPM